MNDDRMYLYDVNGQAISGDSVVNPFFSHMLYSDEQSGECPITANLTGP